MGENVEYDVPKCRTGTPAESCVHVVESVQPIGHFGGKHPHAASDFVDLAFAQPHLHVAGLSLELIDDLSNETLCEVHATVDNSGGIMYGTGVARLHAASGGIIPCARGRSTMPLWVTQASW